MAKNTLSSFFLDKSVRQCAEFEKLEEATGGLTANYFAISSTGEKYILKRAYKNLAEAKKQDKQLGARVIEGGVPHTYETDLIQLVVEYIMAPLYIRLLYDKAPQIELTTSDIENEIYIRSKFLPGVTLSQYSGATRKEQEIKKDSENLKKLNGFEKIIIVSALLGDNDYGPLNLLVNAENDNTISKIDHGESKDFYPDTKRLVESIKNNILYWEYENINFDINKAKEHIKEIKNLTDDEIENLIKNRVHVLIKNGVNVIEIENLIKNKVLKQKDIISPNEIADLIKNGSSLSEIESLIKNRTQNIESSLVNATDVLTNSEKLGEYFINGVITTKNLLLATLDTNFWEQEWSDSVKLVGE